MGAIGGGRGRGELSAVITDGYDTAVLDIPAAARSSDIRPCSVIVLVEESHKVTILRPML